MATRKKHTITKKSLDENKNESVAFSQNLAHNNTENFNMYNNVEDTNAILEIKTNQPVGNIKEESSLAQNRIFYSCQLCYKIFPLEETYKKHVEKCSTNNFHIISNVRFKTTNNNSTNSSEIISVCDTSKSIITPSEETFYTCQYCSKFFYTEEICKLHTEKCSKKNEAVQKDLNNSVININNDKPGLHSTSTNEQTFYTCQYCSKLFYIEEICKLHMEKCSKNSESVQKDTDGSPINIDDDEPGLHSTSTSSLELNVSAREEANVDQVSKQPKYDISIYDYDEEDSEDDTPKIDVSTRCKFCEFTAENPMDLLKHKRERHKTKRQILPPHEIQKYFDYPDRSVCPICEQPIKSKNFRSIFVRHLLVHTAGLTFQCRICKKKFRRIDHMKAHEKRHVLTYAELQAIQKTVDDKPSDVIAMMLDE